jgi:hypothetical protein
VDIDLPASPTADPATTEHGSRRNLLGAGIVGLAASLLPQLAGRVGASASTSTGDTTTTSTVAATTTTAPPKRPTDADTKLLGFAQQVELSAVALYDVALSGKAAGDAAPVFIAIRESHQAYAQVLGGLLGRLAPGEAAGDVVSSLTKVFQSDSLKGLAAAAYDLEGAAVATHQELLGQLIGTDGAALIASILIAEARHATVLADIGGQKDLDTLLLSTATALEPTKG